MTQTLEKRTVTFSGPVKLETRAEGEGRNFIGYGAVFYRDGDSTTEYKLSDRYVERIAPGAFKRTLKERSVDVISTYNHDDNQILARQSNNSLYLAEDEVGLRYEFPFNENDADHRNVAQKIDDGLVIGSSFSFTIQAESFDRSEDVVVRNITDVELYELGPVTRPAYVGTDVALRSMETVAAELESLEEEEAAEKWEHEFAQRKRQLAEVMGVKGVKGVKSDETEGETDSPQIRCAREIQSQFSHLTAADADETQAIAAIIKKYLDE